MSLHLENLAFIKVDVEGAELDVLFGGLGTLARNAYPPFFTRHGILIGIDRRKRRSKVF